MKDHLDITTNLPIIERIEEAEETLTASREAIEETLEVEIEVEIEVEEENSAVETEVDVENSEEDIEVEESSEVVEANSEADVVAEMMITMTAKKDTTTDLMNLNNAQEEACEVLQ
jgi:metal-dependent hydrolase (beta-lactamase superfamily II)